LKKKKNHDVQFPNLQELIKDFVLKFQEKRLQIEKKTQGHEISIRGLVETSKGKHK